jgi:hypothetical protein
MELLSDPCSPQQLWALHLYYLPLIQVELQIFQSAWNNHKMYGSCSNAVFASWILRNCSSEDHNIIQQMRTIKKSIDEFWDFTRTPLITAERLETLNLGQVQNPKQQFNLLIQEFQ